MSFFQELQRRNVFRVGVAYTIAAWICLQFADMILDNVGAPEWAFEVVLIILIVGLFLAIFFAWAFELTPEGLKRERDVDRQKSVTPQTGRKMDRAIIVLLALAVSVLLWDKFSSAPSRPETLSEASDSQEEPAAGSGGSYDSIGVLPFANITNDPEQEYFSDGIAEELLNALAKISSLKVAARTSSFSLKGKDLDAVEIGDRLKVDTVLEGSVRKSGTRLRITAQLIDAANGYHLWSETYDRELTDVFLVQDEITEAIVDALKVHLETGEVLPAANTRTASVDAYEQYLQGKHIMRGGDVDIRDALELFRAATEIDPDFAAAWAARAQAVISLRETAFWGDIPKEEAHLLARNNIDRALALDPRQAEAYVAQGMLFADEYRYDEALASLEQAVAINPSLADAWTWRGRLIYRFGRIKEARRSLLKALDLDPLNQRTAFFAAGIAIEYYDPEYFEDLLSKISNFPFIIEQLELFKRILVAPHSAEVYRDVSASLDDSRDQQASFDLSVLKEFDEARLGASARYPREFVMWMYISINELDKAEAIYQGLDPERQEADLNLEEYSILLTMRGDCEEAIELLDRAHGGELRIYGMVEANMDRSNSQLAVNRAFCLRQLGRAEEAEEVLARVSEFVDTLRENAEWGYAQLEAKFLVLQGETERAIEVLEEAIERFELDWRVRYDPVVATIAHHPRLAALFDSMDQRIAGLRGELGMPPASI